MCHTLMKILKHHLISLLCHIDLLSCHFFYQSVEVGVRWPLDIEVSTADVVDGLVVDHEGTIRVLQGGVGGQDGVVGLNHGCGHLGSWVN